MRNNLKQAIDDMMNEGKPEIGNQLKDLLDDLNRIKSDNVKVITGDMDEAVNAIDTEFQDLIEKTLGELLSPYNISTSDKVLRDAMMTVAGIAFEIDTDIPTCEIALIDRKNHSFINGRIIHINNDSNRKKIGGVLELTVGVLKMSEKHWRDKKDFLEEEEKYLVEFVADTLVELFGADKNKVIKVINSTKVEKERNNCTCPKCRVKKAIDVAFSLFKFKDGRHKMFKE
jgi:hypothetical protein